MLTGHFLFDGRTPDENMLKQIEQPPPDPREHNSAIPDGVAGLILKALEKEPKKRFQTAAEMAAAIQTELAQQLV